MAIANDIRKTVTDTTPVYAVVGATDLIVERVRHASARAQKVNAELEVQRLQERAQQLPTLAVTKALEAAGQAEQTYDDLAVRGKKLVDRIKKQKATQDLIDQGKVTLSRGKAAVTTVRKVVDDTLPAAKSTLTLAKREGAEATKEAKKTAAKRTTGTKTAAKRTATTAKKRTATAKTATKTAPTSAQTTAEKAAEATTEAAEKIGD